MFEQNLLQGDHGHQARCAAIGLTGELGVLVLAILMAANSHVAPVRLSEVFVPLVLSAPPPAPPAAPAPARTTVNRTPVTRIVPRTFIAPRLAAPQTIPQHAIVIADAEPLQDAPGAGVIGGVPGGVPGGSLNGLLGALPLPPAPVTAPKPVVATPPAPTEPAQIRVGGDVEAARLTHEVLPAYPKLAKSARIEGTVRFSATIAADGTVKDLTVLSGQPLLIGAAEDAVKQWIYRPTYLNGRPVEIITEINVNFKLLDAEARSYR